MLLLRCCRSVPVPSPGTHPALRAVAARAPQSPGPVIAPWGLYVGGSKPTGAITWDAAGNPSGDAELMPMVEIWNNGSSTAQPFTITVTVKDGSGATVVTGSGSGSVPVSRVPLLLRGYRWGGWASGALRARMQTRVLNFGAARGRLA